MLFVKDMFSFINNSSKNLDLLVSVEKNNMAVAAILDSVFHRVITLDTEIIHRNMACCISNILVFMHPSDWEG